MLAENSILYRLPPGLGAERSVLLDCIRHSAETAWLSYRRLDKDLTWLADSDDGDLTRREVINSAYLHAWGLVDAIHRYGLLHTQLMKSAARVRTPGVPTFAELSAKVVLIRNINDHLNKTLQNVAAHGNSAMGTLSWITLYEDSDDFYMCLIALGTAKKSEWQFVNPSGKEVVFGPSRRTADIHLAMGEHRANLSMIIPEMMHRVEKLEQDLEEMVRRNGIEGQQAGSDFFFKIPATVSPPENS